MNVLPLHTRIFAVAAFSFALSLVTHAASVAFTDADFANWSVFHLKFDDPDTSGQGPNTATGSGQRVASGGNPGSFLQLSHTMTAGDVSIIGAIKTDFTFNPATDDPFTFLKLDLDIRTNAAGGGSGYQLVVKQNNVLYYSNQTGFGLTTGWVHQTSAPLLLASFDTNPLAGIFAVAADGNRPDFSASGAPIQFGIAINTRIPGGSGSGTLRLDIDNVNVVPEPASALFAVSGAGLLLARRRRGGSSRA